MKASMLVLLLLLPLVAGIAHKFISTPCYARFLCKCQRGVSSSPQKHWLNQIPMLCHGPCPHLSHDHGGIDRYPLSFWKPSMSRSVQLSHRAVSRMGGVMERASRPRSRFRVWPGALLLLVIIMFQKLADLLEVVKRLGDAFNSLQNTALIVWWHRYERRAACFLVES